MRVLAPAALTLLIGTASFAQGQPAPMKTVEPDLLIEAIKDCAAATSPTAVSDDILLSRGWERAKDPNDPDNPEAYKAQPFRAFGKTGGYPFLVHGLTSKAANQCQLMGKLAPEAEEAISTTLELAFAPVAKDEASTVYRYGSHAVAFGRKGDGLFGVIVIDSGEK